MISETDRFFSIFPLPYFPCLFFSHYLVQLKLIATVLPSTLVNKAFRHMLNSKQTTKAHSAKLTQMSHSFSL